VLTDFGISRSEIAGITGTGTVLGTAVPRGHGPGSGVRVHRNPTVPRH
jgi:hypothetical protein